MQQGPSQAGHLEPRRRIAAAAAPSAPGLGPPLNPSQAGRPQPRRPAAAAAAGRERGSPRRRQPRGRALRRTPAHQAPESPVSPARGASPAPFALRPPGAPGPTADGPSSTLCRGAPSPRSVAHLGAQEAPGGPAVGPSSFIGFLIFTRDFSSGSNSRLQTSHVFPETSPLPLRGTAPSRDFHDGQGIFPISLLHLFLPPSPTAVHPGTTFLILPLTPALVVGTAHAGN